MLPKFTKNQNLILETFFNLPGKAYYLREIAGILNKEPGVFLRDINRLADDGILENYYEAHRRFFKLNKKHPLYEEIKSIFFKTSGIKVVLQAELKKIKGIKRAFIYGSVAHGREVVASDIDLFIVGDISEDELIDLINRLEGKFGREINYTLMDEKELQKKTREGNSFLENILKQKTIELI